MAIWGAIRTLPSVRGELSCARTRSPRGSPRLPSGCPGLLAFLSTFTAAPLSFWIGSGHSSALQHCVTRTPGSCHMFFEGPKNPTKQNPCLACVPVKENQSRLTMFLDDRLTAVGAWGPALGSRGLVRMLGLNLGVQPGLRVVEEVPMRWWYLRDGLGEKWGPPTALKPLACAPSIQHTSWGAASWPQDSLARM